MEWNDTPESSNIIRIGYDENSMLLRIEFKNGSTYDYFDVPSHVYEQLKSSPSKGQYLSQNIKGNFRYARV